MHGFLGSLATSKGVTAERERINCEDRCEQWTLLDLIHSQWKVTGKEQIDNDLTHLNLLGCSALN